MASPLNSILTSYGHISSALPLPPSLVKLSCILDSIRGACGDSNEIRILLKGDLYLCLELFKQAVEESDPISQIQLSQAYFQMKWKKDDEKDFSTITYHDLEKFDYTNGKIIRFNCTYTEAFGVENDKIGIETFELAAKHGYLPAILELTHEKWGWHTDSFGFAVQLRPYVGQGCQDLDFCFGQALIHGCEIGSTHYYEGLNWTNRSSCFEVLCPKPNQSFEEFQSYYTENMLRQRPHYMCDGFCFVGRSTVLAPSRKEWDSFVREKLENTQVYPLDYYLFNFNSEEIKSIVEKYELSFGIAGQSEISPENVRIYINTVNIYTKSKFVRVGDVSVKRDTLESHRTFSNPEIQPVISFIEQILIRSGSANSAWGWLDQICYGGK